MEPEQGSSQPPQDPDASRDKPERKRSSSESSEGKCSSERSSGSRDETSSQKKRQKTEKQPDEEKQSEGSSRREEASEAAGCSKKAEEKEPEPDTEPSTDTSSGEASEASAATAQTEPSPAIQGPSAANRAAISAEQEPGPSQQPEERPERAPVAERPLLMPGGMPFPEITITYHADRPPTRRYDVIFPPLVPRDYINGNNPAGTSPGVTPPAQTPTSASGSSSGGSSEGHVRPLVTVVGSTGVPDQPGSSGVTYPPGSYGTTHPVGVAGDPPTRDSSSTPTTTTISSLGELSSGEDQVLVAILPPSQRVPEDNMPCTSGQPEPEGIDIHECRHCGQVFPTKIDLTIHLVRRAKDGRLCGRNCPICDLRFTNEADLDEHLTNHSNDAQFTCPPCYASFQNLRSFKDHWYAHRGVEAPQPPWRELSCFKCPPDTTFPTKKEYLEHMLLRHEETELPYKCLKCQREKLFHLYQQLVQHMEFEHAHQCPACPESFRTKYDCDKHCKDAHDTAKRDNPFRVDEEKKLRRFFACERPCTETFRDEEPFLEHLKGAHGQRPEFECYMCSRRFRDTVSYIEHFQETDLNEKQDECRRCNSTFTSEGAFILHAAFSTCAPKHLCHLFLEIFDFIPEPKIHRVSDDDQSPHFCDKCGEIFKNPNELKEHQRLRHNFAG